MTECLKVYVYSGGGGGGGAFCHVNAPEPIQYNLSIYGAQTCHFDSGTECGFN